MTLSEIEKYLEEIENKLIFESARNTIILSQNWADSFPNESAVYLFRENDEICFVGETESLKGIMSSIFNTKNQTIKRNFGDDHFNEFENYEKSSSKKDLVDEIETSLTLSYIVLRLGRKELEEILLEKFQPKYNIEDKQGAGKSFQKSEKQLLYGNAYQKWIVEDDEKLEMLYCEGKKVKELSPLFKRNQGAIRSRIKKLKLREKYGS